MAGWIAPYQTSVESKYGTKLEDRAKTGEVVVMDYSAYDSSCTTVPTKGGVSPIDINDTETDEKKFDIMGSGNTLNFPESWTLGSSLVYPWPNTQYAEFDKIQDFSYETVITVPNGFFIYDQSRTCSHFRFHSPSEHKINGIQFEVEMELLCGGASIGIFFDSSKGEGGDGQKSGASNDFINSVFEGWSTRDLKSSNKIGIDMTLLARDVNFEEFYFYKGTNTSRQTTCTDGSHDWAIVKDVQNISSAQV
jgi:hypothetical protein